MIDFLHNALLLPYNLFAYIFSIFMWWLFISMFLKYWEDALDESDIFQESLGNFFDWLSEKFRKINNEIGRLYRKITRR